ncbi:MAG: secretin N-terminal domain-containing protein [Candidatus Omnitrophica bacterium]|nr:secretin N-terminal domain-containing protein [Candidatus Omnitrophota bacterium]
MRRGNLFIALLLCFFLTGALFCPYTAQARQESAPQSITDLPDDASPEAFSDEDQAGPVPDEATGLMPEQAKSGESPESGYAPVNGQGQFPPEEGLAGPEDDISVLPDSPQTPSADSGKVSLDLKNIDIVELLRVLSLKTGKTIVPSAFVTGRITIYLDNVAFEDVLDIIVLTQNLALNKVNNIYYVMSQAEYKQMFGRNYSDQRIIETIKVSYTKPSVAFETFNQLKSDIGKLVADEASGTIIVIDMPENIELMKTALEEIDKPLSTTTYDLNYAKAADIKTHITSALTPGTGELIVDERSGKAIVSDLPKKIDRIGELVREIDDETRQVYVEADIIELTLSDKFERGIDWEKVYSAAAMHGLSFAGYFPAVLAQYQKISVGTLAADNYRAVLNFLDTYGKTNIISQPRIAVINNEESYIMVGVREAYITQTQSQATSTTVTSETVEFIDVGVKFKITPRIGADGFIVMKIKPEVSSVKETITTTLGSRIPIVQTSESETTVKVKDGTMIMISGMTKIEKIDTVKGWPVVSKVPFLGALFSSRSTEDKRTEVIVFLTPRLMRGEADISGEEIAKILEKEYLPDGLKSRVLYDEAMDLIKRGEYSPAAEKLRQVAEANPEYLKTQYYLSLAEEELAKEQARLDAAREKELDDKKRDEQNRQKELEGLRRAKEEKARVELAEKERLHKLNKQAKALYNEALSLYWDRKFEAALEKFKETESILPDYLKVRYYLERCLKHIDKNRALLEAEGSRQKPEDEAQPERLPHKPAENQKPAQRTGQRQVIQSEKHAPGPEELAREYYAKGLGAQKESKNKEAIGWFLKAVESDKKFSKAYNSLGLAYEEELMKDKAEQAYLGAVSAEPSYCPAYSNLALICEERQDFNEALEYWRKRVFYGDPGSDWTKQAAARVKELEEILASDSSVTVSDSSSRLRRSSE